MAEGRSPIASRKRSGSSGGSSAFVPLVAEVAEIVEIVAREVANAGVDGTATVAITAVRARPVHTAPSLRLLLEITKRLS